MSIRFYILPLERDTTGTRRGAKYFSWKYDPDPPGLTNPYSWKDYGSIDECIICSNITTADHNTLASKSDVLVIPTNLDGTLNGGAVNSAREFLEGYNIPAGWINAGQTYRSVLRTISGFFFFMQNVEGLLGHDLNLSGGWLELQYQNLPTEVQNAMVASAINQGFDTSNLKQTTTIRSILKYMSDAWGSTPILFGLAKL